MMCNFCVTHDGVHYIAKGAQAFSAFSCLFSYSVLHSELAMATSSSPKPSSAPALTRAAAPALGGSPVAESSDSTSSPSTPDMGELDPQEAFNVFKELTEMDATKTTRFWKQDSKAAVCELFCPSWTEMVKQHVAIHCFLASPSEGVDSSGYVTVWMHSTPSSIQRMLNQKDLGQRYLFESPLQTTLHRMAHAHFSLSSAKLVEGTIILGVKVGEMFLVERARSARNGYLQSTSVDSLPLQESKLKIVGMLHISASLKDYLDSPEGLEFNRKSISQYECFMEASQMDQWNLLTQESLRGLMLPSTPGATKINATLNHQCPELFESWTAFIEEVKTQWKKEWMKEEEEKLSTTNQRMEATALGKSSASVVANLEAGDELTVAVKKQRAM
eukprot:1194821-Amphidinium_carterae.1